MNGGASRTGTRGLDGGGWIQEAERVGGIEESQTKVLVIC